MTDSPRRFLFLQGPHGPWFRQLAAFSPDPSLMTAAPIQFQLHAVFAMILFAMWPFTRLVHVWSGFASVGYIARPWQVVRSRKIGLNK